MSKTQSVHPKTNEPKARLLGLILSHSLLTRLDSKRMWSQAVSDIITKIFVGFSLKRQCNLSKRYSNYVWPVKLNRWHYDSKFMQLKLTGIKLSALSTNVSKICTKLDFSGIQKYFINVKLSGNSLSQIGASVGKFFDRFTVSFSFSLPAEWENVTMWNFLSQFVTLDQPTSRNWLKISRMRQHSTTSTKSLWSCNESFRVSLIFSRIDCRNSWFGSSFAILMLWNENTC